MIVDRSDLVLIKRTGRDLRNEHLPHARAIDALHGICGTVPRVEISYNTHRTCIWRPHGKSSPSNPALFIEVRTELAINVVMIAFAEQMKVEIGKLGHVTSEARGVVRNWQSGKRHCG